MLAGTLLFWGDSLTAQHYYSLVLLLGAAVVSIRDVAPDSTSPAAAAQSIANAAPGRCAAHSGAAPSPFVEGSSPEGSSPEGSSPQGSSPQGSSPEGSSPEGSSPEGSSPPASCGPCEYGGLGSEGGAYTEARLAGGGKVIKVLAHPPSGTHPLMILS